jgi:hypothetical protein
MTFETFLMQNFSKSKYKATPQLGCFDATYTPSNGNLNISIRFKLGWTNSYGTGIIWNETTKAKFTKDFIARVPEYWNDKFLIHCLKWPKVPVVKPTFELVLDDDAHFSINAAGSLGTKNTAVRPDGTAMFGSQAGDRWANADSQMANIKGALGKPFEVALGTAVGGGQISFSTMSVLKSFAQNVAYTFTGPTTPKITLKAMGTGSSSEAKRVKSILVQLGVKNPIKTKSENTFGGGVCKSVEVKFDAAQFERMFPKTAKSKPMLSQATVVHEFGHMMGLPDEYNILCSQSTDILTDYELVRDTQEAGIHLKNTNIGRADASTKNVQDNQVYFHELCRKAGLPNPPFGRPNMNIMSGGSNFEEFHCVTVWKCLCDMTEGEVAPKEWEIRMA